MLSASETALPFLLGLAFLPLGLVMGIPFPTGLRLLKMLDPERVVAVWAVNGAFSVAGSVLAMALAMTAGFATVILNRSPSKIRKGNDWREMARSAAQIHQRGQPATVRERGAQLLPEAEAGAGQFGEGQ